jgi:plasmid stabilization system protein ParE
MASVQLADSVFVDFDRIFDHLAKYDVEHAPQRIAQIREALGILGPNPLIGRKVQGDKRELVIGRASHGYVALYRYLAGPDIVVMLHVRSQREAGYSD